ncbi:competence protein CoiA [Salinadaptatus halalkaliphilus]|uniref:Competence protein CoiA n=1 Tax=Salinadaptatus halalkaliphilus TaxID=2419781 RepID=A0A4S3TLZ1_9EURY|nr:competence protein CoiA family protein [Salinadaptatus halalkaliphilus]THE64273.1 competence protein CoiA [Salinadaptatus halalkaliphilus]
MPFIAVDPVDNRPRIPINVGDDEEVQCPVCDDPLRVREGSSTARHFYHPPDHSCSGESALHLRMKSIAVEKLKDEYPNASIDVEFITDDIPRRADVFVKFEQPRFPLGEEVAVEVQYRNEQKDLTETTASYLADYTSVLWLFEENYVGTRPDYDDVELPDPIPVWPYSIAHGEASSPDPSVGDYLGITEADLIAVLPNHVDDQVSLAEFPSESGTCEETDDLPEWSREKELHLNLSLASLGVRETYKSWLKGKIQSKYSEHRDDVEDRREIVALEDRFPYFSDWFNEGPGDTFELSIDVRNSNISKFTVRKIVADTEISLLLNDDEIDSFSEFVLALCYTLECTRASTSNGREVNQSVESNLSTLSYVITQTGTETVTVELNNTTETMDLEFCPQQIQPLVDLCAKVQLWHD